MTKIFLKTKKICLDGDGSQAEQEDVRVGRNYDPHWPIKLHSAVLWQERAGRDI